MVESTELTINTISDAIELSQIRPSSRSKQLASNHLGVDLSLSSYLSFIHFACLPVSLKLGLTHVVGVTVTFNRSSSSSLDAGWSEALLAG